MCFILSFLIYTWFNVLCLSFIFFILLLCLGRLDWFSMPAEQIFPKFHVLLNKYLLAHTFYAQEPGSGLARSYGPESHKAAVKVSVKTTIILRVNWENFFQDHPSDCWQLLIRCLTEDLSFSLAGAFS